MFWVDIHIKKMILKKTTCFLTFCAQHRSSVNNLLYAKHHKVSIKQDEPFIILTRKDAPLFLLLNDRHIKGNDLSLACIGGNSMMNRDFAYEVMVKNGESSLQLKASDTNVRNWDGLHPGKAFLSVPDNFTSSSRDIVVDVCIRKG